MHHLCFFIGGAHHVYPFLRLKIGQPLGQQVFLLGGQAAGHKVYAHVPLKGIGKCSLDIGAGGYAPKLPRQTGDAFFDGINFLGFQLFHRHAQAFEHGFHVKIHQQRTLKQKCRVAVRAACAGYLAARNFYVVTGAKCRVNAHAAQGGDGWLAQAAKQIGVGNAHAKKGFVADKLPADLVFIKQQAATARNAAIDVDSLLAAVGKADFFLNGLMKAHKHRCRFELQKAQCILRAATAANFKQHLVKSHVLRRRKRRQIKQSPLHMRLLIGCTRLLQSGLPFPRCTPRLCCVLLFLRCPPACHSVVGALRLR